MVFSIEQSKKREDWFRLPDLAKAYEELNNAVSRGDYTGATELKAIFRRVVLISDDLLPVDARQIVAQVFAKIDAAMGTEELTAGLESTLESSRLPDALPPLESYSIYE